MKRTVFLGIIVLSLVAISLAFAADAKRVAIISKLQGSAEVKTASKVWSPAKEGMILNQNDTIRTKKGSTAILNLDGNAQTATVEVKENTELMLAEMIANKEMGKQKTLLDLSLGNILIKAKKLHSEKSSFEVKTPTSVVAVRGTTFAVSVEAVE